MHRAMAAALKAQGTWPITWRALARHVPALGRASITSTAAIRMTAVCGAFYTVACIGSLAVAAGKTPSVRNFLTAASEARVQPAPWLMLALTNVAERLAAQHPAGRMQR